MTALNEILLTLTQPMYLFIYMSNFWNFIFPHSCLAKIKGLIVEWGKYEALHVSLLLSPQQLMMNCGIRSHFELKNSMLMAFCKFHMGGGNIYHFI